jgi:hypothetical protein
VREYIAAQAHLLGAIRLPKGAFAGIASTEVQTDILFLRKRQRAEAVEANGLKLGTVPDSLRHPQCYERYLPINAWYAEHPQFCIGRIRRESNGYEEVPVAVFEGDLEAALAERIALLPAGRVPKPVAHKAPRCGWWSRPSRRPSRQLPSPPRAGASGRGQRDGRRP